MEVASHSLSTVALMHSITRNIRSPSDPSGVANGNEGERIEDIVSLLLSGDSKEQSDYE